MRENAKFVIVNNHYCLATDEDRYEESREKGVEGREEQEKISLLSTCYALL